MSFSSKLKEARIAAGLSQNELAEKLGWPYQRISQYENGYRNPKEPIIKKIADAIGVPASFFIDDEDEFLDSVSAHQFIKRASQYFDIANADPLDLAETNLNEIFYSLQDERYRPTKTDVFHFSDDTGLSVSYLLGLSDDIDANLVVSKLRILGFDEVDVYLIVMKIQDFMRKDLKQISCSYEDAELITKVLLEHIKAENIFPLAKLIDSVPNDIRSAALAVLQSYKQKEKPPQDQEDPETEKTEE